MGGFVAAVRFRVAMQPVAGNIDRSVIRAAGVRLRPVCGRLHRMGAAWFLALGLLAGCGAQDYAHPPGMCITPAQADGLADQLFRLVNMERALADLDPFAWDDELAKVAQHYACRMIEGDFFGHVDPVTKTAPDDRLTMVGYEFGAMGENLATGQRTAAEVLDWWMNSPSHRDNILSLEWTQIGVGVRTSADGTLDWVVEFADPACAAGLSPTAQPPAG